MGSTGRGAQLNRNAVHIGGTALSSPVIAVPAPPSLPQEVEKTSNENEHEEGAPQDEPGPRSTQDDVQLSEFVGQHGAYQLSLTVLLFVRYVFLGFMANSGPLITPDVTFYCRLPVHEVLYIMPNISMLSAKEQDIEIKEELKQVCQIDLHLYKNKSADYVASNSTSSKALAALASISSGGSQHFTVNGTLTRTSAHETAAQQLPNFATQNNTWRKPTNPKIRECTEFSYQLAPDQGRSVTSEFDLVCDRDWLRSLFQSSLSAAIVVAHVFWGTFSDRHGRFQAQRLCLVVSLLAGAISIFAWDFWSFTVTRALCSFGDLGLVVSMTTTLVELVGNKYRGCSVALVNFGYALGVTLLPYVIAYCEDFRLLISLTVLCHMISMPFVLASNESIRWLLTNRKFKAARQELKRIMRWNRRCAELWPSNKLQLSRSISLLERRREFQLKFEQLVQQLESQNLCDPISLSDTSQRIELACATPNISRARNRAPVSKEPRWAGEIKHCFENEQVGGRKASATTSVEIQTEIKPRVLDLVEDEQLMLLKRLEENVQVNKTVTLDHKVLHQTQSTSALQPGALFVQGSNTDTGAKVPLPSRIEAWQEPGFPSDLSGVQCRPNCINLVAHQLGFVGRISRLFKDKKLMIAVFTIVWTTFNSELLYTSFIIINLDVGDDVYLNYTLGGFMEALAAIMASLLLSYSPRRLSLITFWLLISLSCFGLSLAHIDSHWAVWMLALAKFSQSCLSSIASVAAYESFPTFLRQSGLGLVFTLGMLGSVFAPLIFAEFDDHAGMDRVLMTFSVSSLTAAILIYLFLNETRGCELM